MFLFLSIFYSKSVIQRLSRTSLSVSTHHSFLPDDRHPVLHPVDSVGNPGEVVLAQSFLAHGEGAVVGPRQREIIAGTFLSKSRRK